MQQEYNILTKITVNVISAPNKNNRIIKRSNLAKTASLDFTKNFDVFVHIGPWGAIPSPKFFAAFVHIGAFPPAPKILCNPHTPRT
jgi:hypothetical protein